MVIALPATGPFSGSAARLPRGWADRRRLLEGQHGRLEGLLDSLIRQHADSAVPVELDAEPSSQESGLDGCRRLLWRLRLHLRLEERWLAELGVLCPAHLSAHRDISLRALVGLHGSGASRAGRLAWLRDLNGWFLHHQSGPDARAYALAEALVAAETP